MMKFPFAVLVLGAFLVGCALDIPQPPSAPPPQKSSYYVPADQSGPEVRYYDGNDRLLSIDRYERAANGLPLRQYHYSSQDKLMWYKYKGYKFISGSWRLTRERHFLPSKDEGPLAFSTSWAYDEEGHEFLRVDFDADDEVRGYRHLWGETVAAGFRNLQSFGFEKSDEPTDWYELTRYVDSVSNRLSGWAQLGEDRTVKSARQYTYDSDGNQTNLVEYSNQGTRWTRTTGSFVPGTSPGFQYRKVWYSSTETSTPSAPDDAANPPDAPTEGPPTDSVTGIPGTFVDLDPVDAIADFDAVKYVDFPTLPVPSTWNAQAFEYYLPGPHGAITLRFDDVALPDDFVPDSIVKEKLGEFETIRLDFDWDLQGRLTRRVASYAGSPQLTVDFTRDDQGRITRIDTGGPMMKVPLTYHLAYATPTSERPQSISLSSREIDLFTLLITYNVAPSGTGKFGLGGLQFDSQVQSLVLGLGGVANPTEVVGVEFQPAETVGTVETKVAQVFDVLNKADEDKILKGRLVWTTDSSDKTSTFTWQTVVPESDPVSYTTAWTYRQSWGEWANLDDEVVGAVDGAVDETKATMQAKLAEAMALADSFDFERILQLVNTVQAQLPSFQEQFERSAGSLLDQIKTAAGQ